MTMALCVATMREAVIPGDIPLALANAANELQLFVRHNTPEDNLGVVKSYEWLYQNSTADILCMLHDDVQIREKGWDERLLKEFEDPKVGLVGFGGAKWHGTSDLYKRPYELSNLRRGDYLSNVDDAEVHGARFEGSTDVAVLDGYCLAVRRNVLMRTNGWRLLIDNGIDFIAYDYAICAMVRRLGFRIRVCGIRCHHRGGGTSVALKADRQEEYDRSHRWFYQEFMDCMPARVK